VKLVVDASVVIPCFVPERFSDVAETWLAIPDLLLAPDFLVLECANVLWKKVRLGQIAEGVAHDALADIISGVVIDLRPSTPLTDAAFRLGCALDHPIYDCIYLALAEAETAELVTADRGRRRKGVRVPWIGGPLPGLH
jgi:predicted nucleic acid-binding protein